MSLVKKQLIDLLLNQFQDELDLARAKELLQDLSSESIKAQDIYCDDSEVLALQSQGAKLRFMTPEKAARLIQEYTGDVVEEQGLNLLMLAVMLKQQELVEIILAKTPEIIDATDKFGQTALFWAVRTGSLKLVESLMEAGADQTIATIEFANVPIICASARGHLDIVKFLHKHGGDVNAVMSDGRNGLMAASYIGHLDVVEYLVEEAGVDIHIKTSSLNEDAIYLAGAGGSLKVVEYLVFKRADIHAAELNGGGNILTAAAHFGHVEVVRYLLDKGYDVNKVDGNGWTALITAALENHRGIVELLLDADAEVDATDNHGRTAFFWAAARGHKEVVELLLAEGANVNIRDNHGWTVLLRTVYADHKEVVKLLLAEGAGVDVANDYGVTSLIYASSQGYKEVVELLLAAGANVNIRDNNGWTALSFAAQGHKEVVELLLASPAIEIDIVSEALAVASSMEDRGDITNLLKQYITVDSLYKLCTTGELQEIDMEDFMPEKFVQKMKAKLDDDLRSKAEGVSSLEVIGKYFSSVMQKIQELEDPEQRVEILPRIVSALDPMFKELGYRLPADVVEYTWGVDATLGLSADGDATVQPAGEAMDSES